MIDLHMHTTASDGTLSPPELVNFAHRSHLTAIAITDHDTVNGIPEARKQAAEYGLEIIPGVEISTFHLLAESEIHLLGLFIDPKNPLLLQKLSILAEYRKNRNTLFLEHFHEIGIELDPEILFHTDTCSKTLETLGKPDFARALYKAGIVKREGEAYGKYLNDKTGLVKAVKQKIEIKEAIEIIHQADGLAILAHPFHITKNYDELFRLIQKLAVEGLDGMEVFYHNYDRKQVKNLKKIANMFHLLKSGGSDFHGVNSYRNTKIGFYGIKRNIPDDILEKMKHFLTAKKQQ